MGNDVDVLILGAGACGLAAAIAAHDAGRSVAILEKLDRPGGNTALSTGSVPAAGTRFQREAGIADSAEAFERDLMAIAGDTDDPDLLRRLTQVSAQTVEWLVDRVGVRLELVTAYRHVGHSVPRLHAPVSRRGQDLVDDLLAAADRRGIPIAVGNAARELIVASGAVAGAIVETGGQSGEVRAGKTILALNGFANNAALVARFCPEISGAQYFGARGSTGEAVLWGEALGADLANMGAYQGYAAVAFPHGSLLSWTTIEKGGFLVAADGRRFGNEGLGYSGFARFVLERGGSVFAIYDRRMHEIAMQEEEYAELVRFGGVRSAPDLSGLAQIHGLDPEALQQERDAYDSAAGGKGPDRFGRRDFGLAPLVAPYHICRVVPGLFHTQGGLRVDHEARVLRGGKPIPNLFAGGGAAEGISGRTGALGYASGNGLLSAIALGRIAALAAVHELDGEPA